MKSAHHALDMTNLIPSNLIRRTARPDSTAKRPLPTTATRRPFDPIAYAAALEVLG